jgi:hypothetical protein
LLLDISFTPSQSLHAGTTTVKENGGCGTAVLLISKICCILCAISFITDSTNGGFASKLPPYK